MKMPNITAIIIAFVICGFAFLCVAEYLKELARRKPLPAPPPPQPPNKQQALQDLKQWPLHSSKYLKDEPFLAAILQVLDKQPWIEVGMVAHPNSIASRDAFVQAICRQHREHLAKAFDDEKTKHSDEIKKLLEEIKKQLVGVNFTCHRCPACIARKESMGKNIDLSWGCKFNELLIHELQQVLTK